MNRFTEDMSYIKNVLEIFTKLFNVVTEVVIYKLFKGLLFSLRT